MISGTEQRMIDFVMYWTGKEFSGSTSNEAQTFLKENIDEARENRHIEKVVERAG